MNRRAAALLCAICFGPNAAAHEAGRGVILDQLQAKFSACAAFYALEVRCMASGEARRRLAAARKRATALAGAISMSPVDEALRFELNLASQRSLINEGCTDLGILANRYAVECDPLSVDPE